MSQDNDSGEVGYGRPPVHTRFKKGQSGNPGGRPKKRDMTAEEVLAILDEPVTVVHQGKKRRMQPNEVTLNQILKEAVSKKKLRSICYLLELFEKHGALRVSEESVGGVVIVPNTMPLRMGVIIFERFGRPPWTANEINYGRTEYLATISDKQIIEDQKSRYPDL